LRAVVHKYLIYLKNRLLVRGEQMGVKHWVRAMLVLAALPTSAFALGLGDIRLNSPLNAPLDAEIDLVNATPEELAGLRVQLASRETFARYGLEWPAFLGSVTLVRDKNAAGRDVLRVRSREAITEPFVTLLVDANWGRGRLVREYTLLLDPPVFAPAPAPAPAVQAPATAAARSGAVARPPSAQPTAPQAAPEAAPAAGGGEGSYAVRRGDTLSGIASSLVAGQDVSTEQMMVGLYQANRGAFDGSMNVLRAGAVLRIPDAASLSAIDRGTAIAEVRRQRSEWRSRASSAPSASAGAGAAEGRLRLVPPSESGGAGGAGSDAAARETQAMRDRVAQLEKELAESRRLLEVRSAQIADLQQRLDTGSGPAASAPAAPAAGTAAPPAAASQTPPAAGEAAVVPPPGAAAPAAGAEPAAAATQEPAAKPKRKPRAKPAAAPPAAEEPSLLGSLLDSVLQFWWVLAGLLALVAGFFGYRRWQSKRAAEIEDTFGGATTTTAATEMSMPPPVQADTARLRRPNVAAPDKSGFVVEESGEFEAPRVAGAPTAAAAAKTVAADDTLSGETGINLDQGDPLAEADFHMAYGLYDQAADLVRLAVSREPERRDLKLKLAEVYFVWGNRDEFLKTARDLRDALGDDATGEWDKIVIMGKQIAPEDPLFSQATARAASSGLDLQLDGGAQPLDFDVFGDGSGSTQTMESVSNSDLDFGPSRRGEVDPTIERLGPAASGPDAPTVLVEAGGGTTREMAPQFSETPTAESPRLDVDLDELLAGARTETSDAPTVEQPALRGGGPTIRAKLDAALRQTASAGDQTAELAIDDLGLDLGDLEKLGDLDAAGPAELAAGRDEPAASADAPTMLASFDEDAQRLIEKAARRGNGREASIDTSATAAMETLRVDTSALDGERDPGATSMVAALDTTHLDAGDFDLDKLGASGIHKANGAIDLDLGSSSDDEAAPAGGARDDVALPALEPVTISEVGTKLDLARAYMDMGDPDGARNILREVLAEGSVSQKQEANRLLESLPG
jgi:pilus assembly protein FimV